VRILLSVVRLNEALPDIDGDFYKDFTKKIFSNLLEIATSRKAKYQVYLKTIDFTKQPVEFNYPIFVKDNKEFIQKYESAF
jgi:hypothetical protein